MALTVVTASPALNISKTMGSPCSQVIRFSTDKVTLVGDTIQIRLSLFGNLADPDPTAAIHLAAYQTIYPGSPSSNLMNPLPGLHPTLQAYFMVLDYVSTTEFDITVYWLMKMDTLTYPTSLDSTINTWHFEKNAITNPVIDDNSVPAVYNSQKSIQIECIDDDGSTTENAVFRAELQSRFWCNVGGDCCDLFVDCILPGVVGNWGYQLYDENAMLTTGFSAFNDRTIKWQCEFLAGTTPSKYYIGMYRKDSPNNASQYWIDLEFCYAEFDPTMAALSPAPFLTSCFQAGGAAMTNLFGDIWEAEILLDQSYFEPGATYRTFIVVEDNLGDQYSCQTGDIVANGCPVVTFGTIASETFQYDSLSTTYTEDSLFNLATRGRIRIDMILDKASYNAAILTNGLAGNFDLNFTGFGNLIMDSLPAPGQVLSNDGGLYVQFFDNNATDITIRTEFQIPETWDELVKYVVFIFSFDIDLGNGFSYTDQLQKVIKLQLRKNDEDAAVPVFVPTITDQDLNVVDIDEVCAEDVEELIVTYTETELDDFDFIQITRIGSSGDYLENDEYLQTPMDPETNPIVLSADPDTLGGDGVMTLNFDALPLNTQSCIGGVFIKQKLGTPPVCGNIAYHSDFEYISSTEFEERVDFNFDLVPLVDADVTQVVIQWNDGSGWMSITYPNVAQSAPISLNIYAPGGTPVMIVEIEAYIALTNGCFYSASYTTVMHLLTTGTIWNTNLVLT